MADYRPAGFSDESGSDDDYNEPKRNYYTPPQNAKKTTENKLQQSIINSDMKELEDILNNALMGKIDISLDSGWSPLMHACFHGQEDAVNLLLNKGADPNLGSVGGQSPHQNVHSPSPNSEARLKVAQEFNEQAIMDAIMPFMPASMNAPNSPSRSPPGRRSAGQALTPHSMLGMPPRPTHSSEQHTQTATPAQWPYLAPPPHQLPYDTREGLTSRKRGPPTESDADSRKRKPDSNDAMDDEEIKSPWPTIEEAIEALTQKIKNLQSVCLDLYEEYSNNITLLKTVLSKEMYAGYIRYAAYTLDYVPPPGGFLHLINNIP